jgi:hypothetical protein
MSQTDVVERDYDSSVKITRKLIWAISFWNPKCGELLNIHPFRRCELLVIRWYYCVEDLENRIVL